MRHSSRKKLTVDCAKQKLKMNAYDNAISRLTSPKPGLKNPNFAPQSGGLLSRSAPLSRRVFVVWVSVSQNGKSTLIVAHGWLFKLFSRALQLNSLKSGRGKRPYS